MKKTLLLITALTATLCSFAQSRKGLWVTPHVAFGAGTLINKEFIAYDNNLSIYFNAGADVGYMFNDHMGVFAGLSYAGYGFAFDVSGRQYGDALLIGAQGMLEIPTYFRFVASKPHRFGFFTNAGFKYGFLVDEENYLQFDDDKTPLPDGYNYNSLSVSPFVYLGMNIPAGRRVEMTLGPEFVYQFTNLFDAGQTMSANYFNIGLKLGVGIKCGK